MTRFGKALMAVAIIVCAPFSALADSPETLNELDAFWADISRTVQAGDYDGYRAQYHPDAVVVFDGAGKALKLARQMLAWKQGFDDTAAGKIKAGVTFRFSKRITNPATAFEVGIFHYFSTDAQGETTSAYVHFEALSVKKGDRWLMVMERQTGPATRVEYDALQ